MIEAPAFERRATPRAESLPPYRHMLRDCPHADDYCRLCSREPIIKGNADIERRACLPPGAQ